MAHENTYRDDNTYVRQILKKNAQYIFYLHIFIYLIDRERGWVIIKIHALFCYYAIKRQQISTKLIGENMFCMKAHQPSIVLPSKSRLVQLRIYTCYTKTCFFLGVTFYFSRMTYFWSIVLFRSNYFIRSLYCVLNYS